MISRSAGRLRGAHIYQDTEQVLGEIAGDHGYGEQVRNWFRRPRLRPRITLLPLRRPPGTDPHLVHGGTRRGALAAL